jgi:hypothetical protein
LKRSGLKASVASQRAELEELRRLVTNLTLASAVLTHNDRDMPAQPARENVVPIHPAKQLNMTEPGQWHEDHDFDPRKDK